MDRQTAYRRYCRVCWLGGRCFRIAVAGTFASAANWSGIIGAGLLAFVLQQYGRVLMPADTPVEIVALGLFYIALAWCVIFVFRLLVVAPLTIHRDGTWYGNKLVYREPKLAFHAYVSPADNNRDYCFRFPDAPPHSFIHYNIVLDGRADFLSVQVACTPVQLALFKSHNDLRYTKGGIRVNRCRDLCMRAFMREDATPFSVRIYITAWEEGPAHEPGVEFRKDEREPNYSALSAWHLLR